MIYEKHIELRDGRKLLIRSGVPSDGAEMLRVFLQTLGETEFLLTYPDESNYTVEAEEDFLLTKSTLVHSVQLLAFLDGVLVGTASINPSGVSEKVSHRAEFGIAILREYWGLGIGRAMTEACLECARKASYRQVELRVAAENLRAVSLYESIGFVEFGRNPKEMLTRDSVYLEAIYMRLEL